MTKCPTCYSTVAINDGKSTTRYYIPQDELLKEAIEVIEFYAEGNVGIDRDKLWEFRKAYSHEWCASHVGQPVGTKAREFLKKVNHE